MDFLPDYESLTHWLLNYGSFSLFILLALGVVALPVPDETLMVLSGILMRSGELPFFSTILASYAGSMSGITLSYLLGRVAGSLILHRYGKLFGLTAEKFEKVHIWFEHYGKWTLTFGYFIPGVRHLTGFAAGTSGLEYPTFALFAYFGAAIWVSVFLSFGFFLGPYWVHIIALAEQLSDYTLFGIAFTALLLYFLWKKFRSNYTLKG